MKKLYLVLISIFICSNVGAQYYSSIDPNQSGFVDDLKNRIRTPFDHQSYDSYDELLVRNFYEQTDGSKKYVTCVYSGYRYEYTGTFSWAVLSREHTWPNSLLPFGTNSKGSDPYADYHHLFPTHQNEANGPRSNNPLGNVVTATRTYLDSKLGKDANNRTVYEPRDEHKGDAARSLLYMSVRYDGVNNTDWTFSGGGSWQDLYVLLEWHYRDPPDKWEVERNDYIESVQDNRNPFIDHPEYVQYINFENLSYQSRQFEPEAGASFENLRIRQTGTNVTISWDEPSTLNPPDGYLILGYDEDNYFIPSDGINYQSDNNMVEGEVIGVTSSGNSFTFASAEENTKYYFTVYAYTGSGNSINYDIDDNVETFTYTGGDSILTSSTISFASNSIAVPENEGSIELELQIDSPLQGDTAKVDVVLISGDSTDLDNYTTAAVVFPPNSSASRTVTINITDDGEVETDEQFVFEIRNVRGNDDAEIGTPKQFTLTVEDNDTLTPPAATFVIINEWSQGTFANKEWIEILVTKDSTDLSGWKLGGDSNNGFVTFADDNRELKNIPKGTLVLIYNGNDKEFFAPFNAPQDTITGDGNFELILSSSNSSFFSDTDWTGFSNTDKSDNPMLFDSTGNIVHNWDFNNDSTFITSSVRPGESAAISFAGGSINEIGLINNWLPATADQEDVTPGQPNGGDNTVWVDTLRKPVSVSEETIASVRNYGLSQNYPNPFNPSTVINYTIGEEGFVTLKIYDALGREAAELVNGKQRAGTHSVTFDASGLTSGIYFYTITTENFRETRKMILLK